MHISVIGCGYLGVTQAACLASWGHQVLGVEQNPDRVAQLNAGQLPFHEPGLPELLRAGRAAGTLRFSTTLTGPARVHLLCVGTPQAADSAALDLSAVDAATRGLARSLPAQDGRHLLLGKSTVPVGTAARLQKLADAHCPPGTQLLVAWNPEFLREGQAVADTLHPDRIVLGRAAADPELSVLVRKLFAPALAAGSPLLEMDLASAELVKTSANVFLATRISFINAVAEMCAASGADIAAVTAALGLDPRIGPHYLSSGLGFGGGCLPKDLHGFQARAAELELPQVAAFCAAVDAVNAHQPLRALQLAANQCGGVAGRRIALLGASFKAGSDDLRQSPSLVLARHLLAAGAQVRIYDPVALPEPGYWEWATDLNTAVAGAELLILGTAWEQFRALDPVALRSLLPGPPWRLLDACGAVDLDTWRAAGWQCSSLGTSGRAD